MSALTRSARGQPCLVRIPQICNGQPETVIAAHYRSVSLGAGMGLKTNDILTAFCCSSCHDAADHRTQTQFTRNEIRLMLAEGVLRTIMQRWENGQIGVLESE